VKVKWDGGPFKIDDTTESIIRKSELPGQVALLDRFKKLFTGN
jgi:hypothetical protein